MIVKFNVLFEIKLKILKYIKHNSIFFYNLVLFIIPIIYYLFDYSKINLGDIYYNPWSFLLSDVFSFSDFIGERDEVPGDYYLMDTDYFGTMPPGSLIIGKIYGLLPQNSVLVLVLVLYFYFTLEIIRRLYGKNLLLLVTVLNFSFWFGIFRGNNDIYQVPLILFLVYFVHNNKWFFVSFTILILAAIEPYCLLFVLLLIIRKKILNFLITLLLYAFIWITPIFYGAKNLKLYFDLSFSSPKTYLHNMVFWDNGMLFGNSLWGLFKIVLPPILGINNGQAQHDYFYFQFMPFYIVICFSTILTLFFIMYYKSINNFDVLLILAITICLLTPVTAYYKIAMLIPFYLDIFNNYLDYNRKKINVIFLILLITLFNIKPYFIIQLRSGVSVYLDSFLNPLLMIMMLMLLVYKHLPYIRRKISNNG